MIVRIVGVILVVVVVVGVVSTDWFMRLHE